MMSKYLILAVLFSSVFLATPVNALELKNMTQPTDVTSVFGVKREETKPLLAFKKVEVKKEATPAKEIETPKVVTYKVAEGDTLSKIAEANNTTWMRLWQKNTQLQNQDILMVGDELTIPSPDEQLAERGPVSPPAAAVSASSPQTVNYTAPNVQATYTMSSGQPNAYVWGNCTWYVKNVKPGIGGYWGNAGYGWLSNARASGYATGMNPVAGAIGVQNGHVVIIESVNGDGTVNLSEMNYNGGVGVLHYDTRPTSAFIGFIYA